MAMLGPRYYADVHGSSASPHSHPPSHTHWPHSKEHCAVLSVAGDITATVTSMFLPGSPTLPVVMDRNRAQHMAVPDALACGHSSGSGTGATTSVSGSSGSNPIYNLWSIHLELPPQAAAVGLDLGPVVQPSSLDPKESEHLRYQLARQLHESLHEPVAQWFSTAAGLPPPDTTAACFSLDVASPTAATAATAAVVTGSDSMSAAANPFASVSTASTAACGSSSNSAASPVDEAAPDLAALLAPDAEAHAAAALTVASSAPNSLAPPVAASPAYSLCSSGQNHSTDCCVLPQLQLAQCVANAMAQQHLPSDMSVVKYPIQRSLSPTRKRHLAGGSQGSGCDHDSSGSCGGSSGAGYASTGSTCGSSVADTAIDVESQRRALADGRFVKSSSSLPLTSSSRGNGMQFQGSLGSRALVGSISSHPSSAGKPPRPPRRGGWAAALGGAAGRLAGASAGVGAVGLGGRNGGGGVMSIPLGPKGRQGVDGVRQDGAWTTVVLALILAGLLAVLLLLTRH